MTYSVISDGAKSRLFKMTIKAQEAIENASDDTEYGKLKKRAEQWNEIVMALGLSSELRQYYAEHYGGQE